MKLGHIALPILDHWSAGFAWPRSRRRASINGLADLGIILDPWLLLVDEDRHRSLSRSIAGVTRYTELQPRKITMARGSRGTVATRGGSPRGTPLRSSSLG